ncbi:MAG: hypothetical protein AB8G05_23210 [Oligoflexales bacterium]
MKFIKYFSMQSALSFLLYSSISLASGQQSEDGTIVLLDYSRVLASEYLECQKYQDVIIFERIDEICKQNPQLFIDLALKASQNYENSQINLDRLVNLTNLFMVNEIIESFDNYSSSEENLALAFITIVIFFEQIQTQVMTHVWEEIDRQFKNKVDFDGKRKLMAEFKYEIKQFLGVEQWEKVYQSIARHIDRDIRGKTSGLAREVFQLKVRTPVLASMKENLASFDFHSSYLNGTLTDQINLACNYSSLVFQLGLLPTYHTESFSYLHRKTSKLIRNNRSIESITALKALKDSLEHTPDGIAHLTIRTLLDKCLQDCNDI